MAPVAGSLTLEAILKRAAGLRALRNGASTQHEAEAAARALAALLDKHQLEEAEIDSRGGDALVAEDEPLLSYKRQVAWKNWLASILSKHYGVALLRARTARGYTLHLVGRRDDVVIVRYMFAWIGLEAARLLNIDAKGRGAVYRRSWMVGFVAGLRKQLVAARAASWAEASRAALLVLQGREERAWNFAHQELKVSATITDLPLRAEVNGYAAGEKRGSTTRLSEELPAPLLRLAPSSETRS